MHTIEPFYHWLSEYEAAADPRSPFYKRKYSEFYFENSLYNYLIHPQWDAFGSETLYIKILFADYTNGFAIIELMGEWNDCINNDIMWLKKEVIDVMIGEGLDKFMLIGENVLNFHVSGDEYYEEWFADCENGWIVAINFREHVIEEFKNKNIDYYLIFGGQFDSFNWRKFTPKQLFELVSALVQKRIG